MQLIAILLFSLFAQAAGKVVDLSLDKTYYVAGNKALLSAMLVSKPDNPSLEFEVRSSLNGVEQPMQRVTDYQFYAQTAPLAQGFYNWTARVFVQDARLARDLKISIQNFSARIAEIDALLLTETDPAKIAALQAERADKVELRAASESLLASSRTQVHSTYLNFTVN